MLMLQGVGCCEGWGLEIWGAIGGDRMTWGPSGTRVGLMGSVLDQPPNLYFNRILRN